MVIALTGCADPKDRQTLLTVLSRLERAVTIRHENCGALDARTADLGASSIVSQGLRAAPELGDMNGDLALPSKPRQVCIEH